VRIHLGGELLVQGETGLLRGSDLPGRQGRLALARLALSPHAVGRDELADLLWAGQLPKSWERDLSTVLSKVRAALASVGIDDAITNAMGAYQLQLGADGWVDVIQALASVEDAEVALRRDEDAIAQAGAEVGANLARRPFLPGEDGEWVETRRAEQRRVLLRALDALVEALVRRSFLPDALRYASEAVDMEPFRESGYAALMRVQVAAGDRAEALRTYERARRLLADELGIPPSQVLETAYADALQADAEPAPTRVIADVRRAFPEGTVTLVFTDLVRSTERAERLGAERAEEVRRLHFGLLRDAATTRRGYEVKNLGDGLMLAFASAGDAVACAVDIQQSIARHNERDGDDLAVRVGIHVGEPVLDRGDYFGLPVTIASRLCAAAADDEVVVSDLVRILAGAEGESFSSPRELPLKGVTEPVLAWSVMWAPREERPLELPDAVARPDVRFPIVGREDETRRLLEQIEAAARGSSSVVLVAGEPGSGKTRLLSEVVRQAHEGGTTVLWGRCEHDTSAPYRPFTDALAHLVTSADDADLRAWVGNRAPDLARLVPRLGERFGGVFAAQDVEASADRERLFDAVKSLLRSMSLTRPVLFAIDDAHWIDQTSAMLMRELITASLPGVTLVMAYRPTDIDRMHALAELLADAARDGKAARCTPAPLTEPDVLVLLGGRDGDPMHPERLALARELVARTEGNPFFVREVIAHLEETGRIGRGQTKWRFENGLGALEIPEGVRSLVGQRLSRLDADLNASLHAAAVIGREFDLDILAAVTNKDPDPLLEELEPARLAGLVTEVLGAFDRFAFSHALVQETLASELSASRRVRLHRVIGEAIETMRASRVDRHLDDLAHHFAEAAPTGTAGKAVEYLRAAARAALHQLAYEAADTYLRRALELSDAAATSSRERCELFIEHAEVLRTLGDPGQNDAALAAAAIARELGDDELFGHAALTIVEPWTLLGMTSSFADPAVISLLNEGAERLGNSSMGIRIREYLIQTMAAVDWASIEGAHEELVEQARELDDPALVAELLRDGLEADQWLVTDIDQIEAQQAEVRTRARVNRDPRLELQVALAAIIAPVVHGDVRKSENAIADFAALVEQHHLGVYRWLPVVCRTALQVLAGRFDDAERGRLSVLDGLSGAMARYARGISWFTYAELCRQRGQMELVLETVEKAGRRGADRTLESMHVLALIETGQLDEAHAVNTEYAARPRSPAAPYFRPAQMLHRAVVAHRLGDAGPAKELYELGWTWPDIWITAGPLMTCHGSVRYPLGLVSTLLERWDEAEEHFTLARARNAAIGSPPWVAHAEHDHAAMLLRRGRTEDRDRAGELAMSALATARQLGMKRLEFEVTELGYSI
jgi:class 3 adenylate cyclase